MRRLAPDYRTIAAFRHDNPEAIVAASAAFVQFCRKEVGPAGFIAPRIAGEYLGGDANLRGNEGEHVGRRVFLRCENTARGPQIGEKDGKPQTVRIATPPQGCTNGRLHNKPRQNMFMNLIDRWRGFLIGCRRGLGGCNPKTSFRLARRSSATLIFCLADAAICESRFRIV
jgi:hypothetical protein